MKSHFNESCHTENKFTQKSIIPDIGSSNNQRAMGENKHTRASKKVLQCGDGSRFLFNEITIKNI